MRLPILALSVLALAVSSCHCSAAEAYERVCGPGGVCRLVPMATPVDQSTNFGFHAENSFSLVDDTVTWIPVAPMQVERPTVGTYALTSVGSEGTAAPVMGTIITGAASSCGGGVVATRSTPTQAMSRVVYSSPSSRMVQVTRVWTVRGFLQRQPILNFWRRVRARFQARYGACRR